MKTGSPNRAWGLIVGGALLVAGAVSVCAAAADNSLLDAIRRDDTQRVPRLLKSGADPSTHDETGATALMHAVIHASTECVRLLLDQGADVNGANNNGSTARHFRRLLRVRPGRGVFGVRHGNPGVSSRRYRRGADVVRSDWQENRGAGRSRGARRSPTSHPMRCRRPSRSSIARIGGSICGATTCRVDCLTVRRSLVSHVLD